MTMREKVQREKVREKVRLSSNTLVMNKMQCTWCELLHPTPFIIGGMGVQVRGEGCGTNLN
jgi:hypothetical protein